MEACRRRSTGGAMAYGDGGRSTKRNTEAIATLHENGRAIATHICLEAEATSSEGSGRWEINVRAGPGRQGPRG